MKIAIVGSRHLLSRYSGIEAILLQLLPRLVARGHEVTVFANRLDGASEPVEEYQGVRLISVGHISGKYSETLTRSAAALTRAVRENYDVVHFQHQGPGILSGITRGLGIPSVVSVHGLDWRRDKWGSVARMCIRGAERVAVRFADRIIVVSKGLERYFRDEYGLETVCIPAGLSAKAKPVTTEPLTRFGIRPEEYVLFAARLVPEKGCHDLIAAWNRLDTRMKLVIAGAARYDAGYVRQLRSAADPEKVIFTGHLEAEEYDAVLANAYIAILPSYMEGLSIFLLEALAFGRCVLVSDIPENLEAIGELGFSFPVGDVDALREVLAQLVANQALARAMMDRVAQAPDGGLGWDEAARLHEEVYLSLARKWPRRSQQPA